MALPLWIANTVKTIYTMISVAGTTASGFVCPPCTPAVGGAFALGGMAVDYGLSSPTDKPGQNDVARQENRNYKHLKGALTNIMNSLDSINGTVVHNNEMLGGIHEMIKGNAEETRRMFKELQVTMKAFEQTVNRNFEELKMFIVEKDFTEKFFLKIEAMWTFMQETLETQTKFKKDAFLDSYKANPPRVILKEFILGLKLENHNPIKSSMEFNVLKSKAILDQYMHLLSQIIFKVFAIEGFYYGIQDIPREEKDVIDQFNGIASELDETIRAIRSFVAEYRMRAEKYWPENVLRAVNENMGDLSNLTRAVEHLKITLEGIYTKDVFAIYLWNSTDAHQRTAIYVPPGLSNLTKEQYKIDTVKEFESGATFAMVLRSEKFHEMRPEAAAVMRACFRTYAYTQADLLKSLNIEYSEDLRKTSYLSKRVKFFNESYSSHGFVAFNVTPAVSFTNNGSTILTDEDLGIIPVYHGLTWM